MYRYKYLFCDLCHKSFYRQYIRFVSSSNSIYINSSSQFREKKMSSVNRTFNKVNNIRVFHTQSTSHGGPLYQHSGISDLARDSIDLEDYKVSDVTQKELFNIMISYVWPKERPELRRRVLLALSLLAGAKLTNCLVPFAFKYTIDNLSQFTHILEKASETMPEKGAMWASALVLGYGVARFSTSSMDELRRVVFATVAQSSVRRIANRVFLHLHELDLHFHLRRRTGALDRAIGLGSRGINTALSLLVFNMLPVTIELSLVTGILWYKCGADYALLAALFATGYSIFTIGITQWRTEIRRAMNRADQQAGNLAHDSLINYETVKYFGNESHEVSQYDHVQRIYEKAAIKTTTTLSFLNWGQQTMFTLALTVLMLKATSGIMAGQLTVGDLVLVNGLLFQLNVPLNFLGSTFREIKQALVDMQTMFRLLKVQSKIKEKENAPALDVSSTNADIVFDNVNFEYVKGHPILQGLSFKVPAGKKVAIVGGSGSGKSTIVRLLYRFYDPSSGSITINGQSIHDVHLKSLRDVIGVVPQDTVMFHNTIRYNLRYAKLDATDEEVELAAKSADLHDSIVSMPLKYDTQVGERGLILSGGEKQRLAIARAILKNPPIFVYDEATSSLDSITEQHILNSLRRAVATRTTIVIAHRLSTVVDADEILVLENGKVAEKGSHDELISDPSSKYSELWRAQNIAAFSHKKGEKNNLV